MMKRTIKTSIVLISALCFTYTVSAQHRVAITYTLNDRILEHEKPFPSVMDYDSDSPLRYYYDDGWKGNPFPNEAYSIPISVDPDGTISVSYQGLRDIFGYYKDALRVTVCRHIEELKFNAISQTGSQYGTLTYAFVSEKDKAAEIINIPESPTQETFIFPLVYEMLSDLSDLSTVDKDSIVIYTVRALANIYKYPKSMETKNLYVKINGNVVKKDVKELVFKFINDGDCFPFEYCLIEEIDQLVERLANNVRQNQPNAERVNLLHTIKSMTHYVYNSRVIKRCLTDLDKSDFDWHEAIQHKIWKNVFMTTGLKKSYNNTISFVENIGNHTEIVEMSFAKEIISTDLGGNYFTGWWKLSPNWWSVEYWVKIALSDYFEHKFRAAFEEYKIQGYPKADSQEEVSKLLGAAIIRTKFIDFKNRTSPLEVALNNFTAKWNTVNIIYVQKDNPEITRSENALNEFLKENIKMSGRLKRLFPDGTTIPIRVEITKWGEIKAVRMTNDVPPLCKDEILRVLNLVPSWVRAQNNFILGRSHINLEIPFKITK